MTQSIFERMKAAAKVLNGTLDPHDNVGLVGYWDVEVIRADGTRERKTLKNQVTQYGMNRIADLAVAANVVSAARYVVVGTGAVGALTPSLSDTQSYIGECGSGRKLAANAASTNAQSIMWMSLVATYAGFVDGLTGIALDTAALADYASSSNATGIIFNRVTGLGVTLQNSDFLNLTVRISVGSHNGAQST